MILARQRRHFADLGVSYQQSSDWQKLAGATDEQFEAALDGHAKPTTAGIIREVSAPQPEQVPVSRD